MATINRRQEQLFGVIDNLIQVHNDWSDDESRPNPDGTYWDAVDAVFTTFEHGDIPEACRKAFLAVEKLREAHDEFQNEADDANQYPGDHFWEAIDGLRRCRATKEKRELPPLEKMSELLALPGMTKEQIARMYGLVDQNGNAQVHLVQKELDKPGSVIDDKWVDPRLKLIEQEEEASDDYYSEMLERKNQANAAKQEPCKESIEELHALDGMTPAQAAHMLKKPLNQVAKRFAELDRDRDRQRRAEVLEMSREGNEPKDIAKELGMTVDAVKKIIVAANEAEEPVGTAK